MIESVGKYVRIDDAYIFPNTTVKGQSPFQEQIRIRKQGLRSKVGGKCFYK